MKIAKSDVLPLLKQRGMELATSGVQLAIARSKHKR